MDRILGGSQEVIDILWELTLFLWVVNILSVIFKGSIENKKNMYQIYIYIINTATFLLVSLFVHSSRMRG